MNASSAPGSSGPLVAGVDVGGTKTLVVVTDDLDRVLYEHAAPTDRTALVDQIAGLVDDARRQLAQDIAAVGVAIPGHVDPEDGSVSMAVNLGITYLPLGSMLQTELGVPIFVEHDARAAALWLSEQVAGGSTQAPASIAYIAIGTGISAGIVLDGAAASRRQRLCRRGGPHRRRSGGRRLRVWSARLPRDHRRRSRDRSPGRRGDHCRSEHRPVAASECRRCLPRQLLPATRSRSRSPTEWPTT